ncbi:4'-phosphopantetheinyl transferase superfamily protein [Candidatus Haliotispira prima]|uniref:4'-phosphopantetheinyl transferase superfamily protein n=1 Tax=Candidatus Haliotispira prima TaxID=3034016 RepID=A0ABY8MGZ4_9SPIO|nr:4'-phosphopantetheinyl transferase superfamily protein [Candidatus Haliotispira prima]
MLLPNPFDLPIADFLHPLDLAVDLTAGHPASGTSLSGKPRVELYIAPYSRILESFDTAWPLLLPPEEQKRAESFRVQADRERFIAGRLLLRCLLSRKCSQFSAFSEAGQTTEPRDWQLKTEQYGKPYLSGPPIFIPPSRPLSLPLPPLKRPTKNSQLHDTHTGMPHFNLAHSGAYVALAFSEQLELGLDIEQQQSRRHNLNGIARLLFEKTEQQTLQHLLQQDTERAEQLFFQLWCRYEALSKLEGTGLLARPQNCRPFSSTEGHFYCDSSTTRYFWALSLREQQTIEAT